jgi:predicted polyphosphate/ATP-dependent NAD kinase
VSTYAAFNFYHLIAQPTAFGVMTGVTMLAAWLADRQGSQGLALVAVGGGFGTLSEIALALRAGLPVIGLATWGLTLAGEPVDAFPIVRDPEDAARLALDAAAASIHRR